MLLPATRPQNLLGPGRRPLGPLAFTVAYLVPLLLLTGPLYGGWGWYAVPAFVFLLIPLLDSLLGTWLGVITGRMI